MLRHPGGTQKDKQREPNSAKSTGDAIFEALPDPVIVANQHGQITRINLSAEDFFNLPKAAFLKQDLGDVLPTASPIFALVDLAFKTGNSVAEYGIELDTPHTGQQTVMVQVAPIGVPAEEVLIQIGERSIAKKIDQRNNHRHAVRSISGMAAMLAHELRNPLLSIRGAAQLLEQQASDEDRELTQLIREETSRIKSLVDRVEVFTDTGPLDADPVNIHEVLQQVRRSAQAGFCEGIEIEEAYDPSLPPIRGNREQLIQLFLNLLKNAAEAAPSRDGEIKIATSYNPTVRLTLAGQGSRIHLPLQVTIEDNGIGIPEDVRPHLFDPFVTTKSGGTGLGLALVAKLVADHGGIITFESEPGRTLFRVSLPIWKPRAAGTNRAAAEPEAS
ncbi:MAG: PAS domain-containing protein [Alphaproteobacteria bacterium]|nr:PAS domain-containing protein [Alphaproteobacteria bacterium SS10]